jgi:DNA-directed RNA polymerase I, II, and III subunit RPABC1
MEKIYKSFNIIGEMLADRNIKIDPALTAGQIDTFIANQNNKPGFEVVIGGGKIRLVYYLANKFKWSELKKFFEDDKTYELTILIVREKISQNNLKQLSALGISMQIFLLKELQFNISKHELVPKHELVSDPQEIKHVLDVYSLKSKNQLPIILKTDPMARWLNLGSGDIVRISRPSPTSGFYVTYRCCM